MTAHDRRQITCIEDLRRIYQRRVPRMFYDYAESGSYSEQTFRANSEDFARIGLRQRVAQDISNRSTAASMIGQPVAMPVALSPVGSAGMQCADGEIKAARAAARFGVPFTLSTMSICSMEDVADAVQAPFWFQLYVMRDPAFVDSLIDRARAVGCNALVLTLDLPVIGQRHRDIRNGLSVPLRLSPRVLLDLAGKPGWAWGMARTHRRSFGNIIGHAASVDDLSALAAWTGGQFEQRMSWDAVARIRDRWGGKLVIKGIMEAEDADQAVAIGSDAIVVSNHGGRQLDGASSTIRKLPEIVAAVAGRCALWLDSGIRSGQDILKALALGATGTMIGRAYVYGLGAMGEAGVTEVLNILQRELDISMALCGVRTIDGLGGRNIDIRGL